MLLIEKETFWERRGEEGSKVEANGAKSEKEKG